ncbi:carboxymuconolactone decarboxylase family protein [Streptomyces sp. NPDC001002]
MDDTEETYALRAARDMRRKILGDAYVDAATSDPAPAAVEFQDYLTATAWGVWTRNGVLGPRDRSLLVLAMTAALGRMEEFRVHVDSTPRTGVTDAELDELLFQVAAYCGVPAGSAARRVVRAARAERVEGE